MENKNLNFSLIMIILTFLIIYFFAIFADYILHLKQFSARKTANEIVTLRKQNEDRPQIKEAKKENYVRLIFPYLYHKIEDIEKNFINDLVPLNAQPYKLVYDCNEGYGLIKYKTDRFGFRNNDNIWDQINSSEKDKILFIGDSFVHGSCVENKYIISNNIKGFQNYNVASSGNDPYTYTALTKLFVPIVKPKYVLLIFYENDNSPDGKIFLKNLKIDNLENRYFKFENNKIFLSDEIGNIINNVEKFVLNETKNREVGTRPNIIKRAARYLTLPTIRKTLSSTYKNISFNLPTSTKLSIDTLNNQCKKYKCIPIYGFIPNSNFWEPSASSNNYKKSIEKYLEKKKSFYIDFTKVLSTLGEKKAFAPKGTHLSIEGYKSVSQEVEDFLNLNFGL